jgi:hypothetical protein
VKDNEKRARAFSRRDAENSRKGKKEQGSKASLITNEVFVIARACCVNLFYRSFSSLASGLKHFTAEVAKVAEMKH